MATPPSPVAVSRLYLLVHSSTIPTCYHGETSVLRQVTPNWSQPFQTSLTCLHSIPQVVWLAEDPEGNVDITDLEQKLIVSYQPRYI